MIQAIIESKVKPVGLFLNVEFSTLVVTKIRTAYLTIFCGYSASIESVDTVTNNAAILTRAEHRVLIVAVFGASIELRENFNAQR